MRSIVAGRIAVDSEEFAELALGVDSELFVGVPGESPLEYEARVDAALAVLADLDREDPELAAFARRLMDAAPEPEPEPEPAPVAVLADRRVTTRRPAGIAVAA